MANVSSIAAVEGFSTTGQVRLVAYQAARLVHAPANAFGFQPEDGTLTALAALNATPGFVVQTGADAFTKRTLQQPAVGFTIANPAGTAGDPTFALANDLAGLEGLGGQGIAVRTGTDAWSLRTITQPVAGITVSNGNGASGNPTLALANDLAALELLASTGLAARTGTDTWAQRTITGTANQISVSNGSGAAGNPTLSLTVGDIVVGTWTPTLTSIANVDSTTAFLCSYARIGAAVICWGPVAVDPTAATNTATSIGISLPIASNLSTGRELAGTAAAATAHRAARVIGDATADTAILAFASESTASITFTFIFGYLII